jgi:hypothetical protein
MTGVDSAEEGDRFAREYQRVIRSGLTVRCELIENNDAATNRA